MNSLQRAQALFSRVVRFRSMPDEVDAVFVSHGRLAVREGLEIYRNAYWYRQVDAMHDCFPKLAEHLGTPRFTELVCRYVAAHPSESPILELLGRELSSFLRPSDPLRADLAALEHARLVALLAPAPPSVATVADVDAGRLPGCAIELSPAVVELEVSRSALALWLAPTETPTNSGVTTVVAYRRYFAVLHVGLEPDEAEALRRARRGADVEEICGAFVAAPHPAQRAAEVLGSWLNRTWICSFRNHAS